jgi:hypothetical protein
LKPVIGNGGFPIDRITATGRERAAGGFGELTLVAQRRSSASDYLLPFELGGRMSAVAGTGQSCC